MKCMRGAGTERFRAPHADVSKLRQRLPAEAGAAGAEHDHIGRAVAQPGGSLLDLAEIGRFRRQTQQRQAFVRMRLAQPVERALAAAQHIVERGFRHAMRADRLGSRVFDVLLKRHPGILPRCGKKVPKRELLALNSSWSVLARGRPPP